MSARSVIAALDPARYDVVPIGITKEGRWLVAGDAVDRLIERASAGGALEGEVPGAAPVALLADPSRGGQLLAPGAGVLPAPIAEPLDVIFPLIHGRTGEDGALQGLLDLAGVAYVGAGVLGSALGMDKVVAKTLWQAAQLPVGPWVSFPADAWRADPAGCTETIRPLGYPCFVKPANSGSSIGVAKVHDVAELGPALDEAATFDTKLLVETAIVGRELECGVVGNARAVASVVGEIIPGHEFYDYEDKYFDNTVQLVIPAALPDAVSEAVRALAVRAFQALDVTGMARVDFFLEASSGRLLLNEINTIPGFTGMSMFPRLWEATGVPFPALCDRLIALALERWRERVALRPTR